MAPQILHRVIHGSPDPEPWQKALLTFQPAILHGYRRHRVRGADYPGIIPVGGAVLSAPESQSQSQTQSQLQGQGQGQAESARPAYVLGTLVSGLTDGDIHRLGIFEGSEYTLRPVKVRTLQESLGPVGTAATNGSGNNAQQAEGNNPDGSLRDVLEAAGAEFADESEEDVKAVTYVYTAGERRLDDAEWDFESFKRGKMAWWLEANESEW